MAQIYAAIYLSPHLDDAALSCGGQIFVQTRAGKRVLVVTVAAGAPQTEVRSPFAQFMHHNWGLTADEVIGARQAEDAAACARLGAETLHWPLPDCIYRLHPQTGEPLYTSDAAIFGPVHPAETPLVAQLAGWMAALPPSGRVVAPLTLGHHVDHQLTRAAAVQCFGDALYYYEDYPYVQRRPEELAQLLVPAGAWHPQTIPLDDEAIQARVDACLAYRSQLGVLFGSADTMVARIRQQIAASGGERLWRRAA